MTLLTANGVHTPGDLRRKATASSELGRRLMLDAGLRELTVLAIDGTER
jgi:hypothetical protein